jgi:hypothetical protein
MGSYRVRFTFALAALGAWMAACSGAFAGLDPEDASQPRPDADQPDAMEVAEASLPGVDGGDAAADVRDAARLCQIGAPFRTVRRVDHAPSGAEPDGLADAGPSALSPVPGKPEAWLVVDRAGSSDGGQRLIRMRGTPTDTGDGGVAYSGGVDVAPFAPGFYDGVTFTPQATAIVGLNSVLVRAIPDASTYGAPTRITLPPPITRFPGSPFVTADGRTLFFSQDSRVYVSDISSGSVDTPPSPRELGLSFGADHLVTTPAFDSAYWVDTRGQLVGGVIRDGDLRTINPGYGELEAAAPGLKYPAWLSEDGCLLFFVHAPEAGAKVLWFARKG